MSPPVPSIARRLEEQIAVVTGAGGIAPLSPSGSQPEGAARGGLRRGRAERRRFRASCEAPYLRGSDTRSTANGSRREQGLDVNPSSMVCSRPFLTLNSHEQWQIGAS